jgi:hypothetical protein
MVNYFGMIRFFAHFDLMNKIVQRFYETPAPLKAGRDLINEGLKFLSPQPRKRDLRFISTSYGVFRNFYHSSPGCGIALSL